LSNFLGRKFAGVDSVHKKNIILIKPWELCSQTLTHFLKKVGQKLYIMHSELFH